MSFLQNLDTTFSWLHMFILYGIAISPGYYTWLKVRNTTNTSSSISSSSNTLKATLLPATISSAQVSLDSAQPATAIGPISAAAGKLPIPWSVVKWVYLLVGLTASRDVSSVVHAMCLPDVIVWQVLLGFVLPSAVLYYLELRSRRHFLQQWRRRARQQQEQEQQAAGDNSVADALLGVDDVEQPYIPEWVRAVGSCLMMLVICLTIWDLLRLILLAPFMQ